MGQPAVQRAVMVIIDEHSEAACKLSACKRILGADQSRDRVSTVPFRVNVQAHNSTRWLCTDCNHKQAAIAVYTQWPLDHEEGASVQMRTA